MKPFLPILLTLCLLAAPAAAQTLKSLMYNTTNGQVVYGGTNTLTFNTAVTFNDDVYGSYFEAASSSNGVQFQSGGIVFLGTAAAATRTNLGLGSTWLTNTNVTNFRSAIGLGATNDVTFKTVKTDAFETFTNLVEVYVPLWIGDAGTNDVFQFEMEADQAKARTNLGLGWPALTNTNAATSLLGFTTNGQVVANTGTNVLTFTNNIAVHSILINDMEIAGFGNSVDFEQGIIGGIWEFNNAVEFGSPSNTAITRTNLALGLPALTNTSNADFRSAVGVAPSPIFKVLTNDFSITNQTNMTVVDGLTFNTEANKRYVVQLFPIISSANQTEAQIVASNATVYGFWGGVGSSGLSGVISTTNALTNVQNIAFTAQRSQIQHFHVVAGTNAGSVSLQFRSAVATNTNTIGEGSYMMAQEVVPTP